MSLRARSFAAPRRLRRPELSYVVGDEVFWGQDRLPLLEAHLAALASGA